MIPKRNRKLPTCFLREYFRSVLEARFRKLPQGSDSDSGSEAGSVRPMKLPCNVGYHASFLYIWNPPLQDLHIAKLK